MDLNSLTKKSKPPLNLHSEHPTIKSKKSEFGHKSWLPTKPSMGSSFNKISK
jgi:hypothetical protein